MKEINVNADVYIRLNPRRLPEILDFWHKKWNFAKDVEAILGKPDTEGYYKVQLWEVMQYFGPVMKTCGESPFYTSIRIDESDIKDLE